MLASIRNIFKIITQIIAIYSFITTLIEIDLEEEEGKEKKETAIEWLKEVGKDLVERDILPQWAYEVFFEHRLMSWFIDFLVKIANRLGFFG